MRQRARLVFVNDILYRKIRSQNGREFLQYVIPDNLIPVILDSIHSRAHRGMSRMKLLLQTRGYWDNLSRSEEEYCGYCAQCNIAKLPKWRNKDLAATLCAPQPFDLISVDFTKLEKDNRGFQNLQIITDVFTKFSVAVPTKDQKATTAAKCFFERLICYFGAPVKLHSDQGASFQAQIVHEHCRAYGLKNQKTSTIIRLGMV